MLKIATLLFIITTPITLWAQENHLMTIQSQSKVNNISSKLVSNEIARIEILQYPLNILTRTRITPEMLEKQFYFKIIIRNVKNFQNKEEFIETIKSIKVKDKSEMPDIRWGVIFYDLDDNRICTLYFNAKGNYGAVDSSPVSFSGKFFEWIDKKFSEIFRKIYLL